MRTAAEADHLNLPETASAWRAKGEALAAGVINLVPPASKRLKVYGMGRVGDNDKAILLMLNGRPTDDQLRYLHEVMERAVACMPEDL